MTLYDEIREDYKNPKKKRKPRAKKKKPMKWQHKAMIWVIILAFVLAGVYYVLESWHDWRTYNRLQWAWEYIGWVDHIEPEENRPVVETKETELTDIEIIEQHYYAPILKTVYFLESTSGQNDYCKEEGMVNGFGFRQNTHESKCYKNFEAVVLRVNDWFEERLGSNGNDLIEAVCYYNTGVEGQLSCGDYSANFFSVISNNF